MSRSPGPTVPGAPAAAPKAPEPPKAPAAPSAPKAPAQKAPAAPAAPASSTPSTAAPAAPQPAAAPATNTPTPPSPMGSTPVAPAKPVDDTKATRLANQLKRRSDLKADTLSDEVSKSISSVGGKSADVPGMTAAVYDKLKATGSIKEEEGETAVPAPPTEKKPSKVLARARALLAPASIPTA